MRRVAGHPVSGKGVGGGKRDLLPSPEAEAPRTLVISHGVLTLAGNFVAQYNCHTGSRAKSSASNDPSTL